MAWQYLVFPTASALATSPDAIYLKIRGFNMCWMKWRAISTKPYQPLTLLQRLTLVAFLPDVGPDGCYSPRHRMTSKSKKQGFEMRVDDVAGNRPGGYCSLRNGMAFSSRDEGSNRVLNDVSSDICQAQPGCAPAAIPSIVALRSRHAERRRHSARALRPRASLSLPPPGRALHSSTSRHDVSTLQDSIVWSHTIVHVSA